MQFKDDTERLIAEQAALAYRAVCEAAEQAAFGHGMEAMEEAVLKHGREQQRQMLEQAAKTKLESEKGGRVAHAADPTPRSSEPPSAS